MKDKDIKSVLIGILLLILCLAIVMLCNLSSITQSEITISDLQHWQVSHQEVHAVSNQEVHAESESYKTQDLITYGDCHLCHDPIIRTINYERGE